MESAPRWNACGEIPLMMPAPALPGGVRYVSGLQYAGRRVLAFVVLGVYSLRGS